MATLSRRRVALIVGAVLALVLVGGAVALALILGRGSPTAAPSPSASASPSASGAGPTSSVPITTGEPSPTVPSTAESSAPPPSDVPLPPATTAEPEPPAPSPPEEVPPSSTLPDALRGLDIERLATARPVVALTFDAGANDAGLASILSTLAAERVPATFFLTGTWAQANPAKVAQIAAAGQRIGNHSMTHPDMTGLSDAQIGAELARAQTAILAGGADPRPLFRFPLGARNARTIAAVNASGYAAVRWTVDTLGWQGTMGGTRGAGFVAQRVMAALVPGEIVLMHVGSNPQDGSTLDADALPSIISQLRAAGYGFTTLDILL